MEQAPVNRTAATALAPGVILASRYRLGEVLGAGGMGTVHHAEHLGTGGAVAVKLLNPERIASPRQYRRFEMEARNAAVLQHVNTVRVFDYGLDAAFSPPLPYLAMELVPGRSVADVLDREGRLPWPRVVRIAAQVLKSLWEAHEHPRHIVHRDIKPSNILVCDLPGETDFVKVADFGVARALAVPGEDSDELAGSPTTMAPECWVGGSIGPATDLYSLGCTVYEMLAGELPFEASNILEWSRAHRSEAPRPLMERARPGTPAELGDWVGWLLRKPPALRPGSAREALRLLEAIGPLRAGASAASAGAQNPPPEGRGGATAPGWASSSTPAARRGARRADHDAPQRGGDPHAATVDVRVARAEDSRPLTNLPPSYTPFVGRQAEYEALSRLLAARARLVTVHGPAGTGKTRLCVEWARSQVGELAGGIWFADLTAATTLDGVLQAVARILRVPLTEGDPIEQLGTAMSERGPALLVLDNVEQVVADVRRLLETWLGRATEVLFLVTSRTRLGIAGEQVLALSPLPLPEAGDVLTNEAVALFVERARAVQPSFALDDENSAAVAALVRRLDGLPLGIELAAARVRLLTPARLLERLENGQEALSRGDAETSRHAALTAAIDWSWRLLGAAERQALAQCSVFRGGFGLDAAERVIDVGGGSTIDVLESLCDQSLLVVSYPDRDEPRFSMLVSVQTFASARLSESGARHEVCGRHAAYYARLGAEAFADRLGRDPAAIGYLERDLGNLMGALAHGLADPAARMHAVEVFGAIRQLARRRGPHGLALEAGRPLAACEDLEPSVRARLLIGLAGVANVAGQLDEAARGLELAERLLARVPPEPGIRAALENEHALLRHLGGRLDAAKRHAERAMKEAAAVGEKRLQLDAATVLAATVRLQGEMDRAIELFQAGLTLAHELGDRVQEARCHANLGAVLVELDRARDAKQHLHYADDLASRMGDRRIRRWARMNWVVMSRDLGEIGHARQAVEQALGAAEHDGDARLAIFCRVNRAMLDLDQGRHTFVRERVAADLAVAKATKQPQLVGMMLLQAARLELELGELEAARRTTQDFYAVMESLGDPLMQLTARLLMARLFEAEGGLETADAFLQDSLEVARENRAVRGEGEVLGYQSQVRLAVGRVREAAGLAGAAVERLRGIDAAFELGVALAQQARVAVTVDDTVLSGDALAEAEGIAARFEAVAPSALVVAIERARSARPARGRHSV